MGVFVEILIQNEYNTIELLLLKTNQKVYSTTAHLLFATFIFAVATIQFPTGCITVYYHCIRPV